LPHWCKRNTLSGATKVQISLDRGHPGVAERKIAVDRLEIRRLRRIQGLPVDEFLISADMGLRTLKAIEASGKATEEKIRALAKALNCPAGVSDLKPVLLAGHQLSELRQRREWTEKRLSQETTRLRSGLGELCDVTADRIHELEQSAVVLAMHNEWRLLAIALGCDPQSLAVHMATNLPPTSQIPIILIQRWIDKCLQEIVASQDCSSGGFWTSQSWTCAQLLLGILTFPDRAKMYQREIHHALRFLEASRIPGAIAAPTCPEMDQGWPLYYYHSLRVPIVDVTCWVLIAMMKAWEIGMWPNERGVDFANNLTSEVQILLSRQLATPGDSQNGGFCPTSALHPENVRTYTTAMALWTIGMAAKILSETWDPVFFRP
jgi:hypothetical protein